MASLLTFVVLRQLLLSLLDQLLFIYLVRTAFCEGESVMNLFLDKPPKSFISPKKV